jgi:vacuolar-type H+-ATPase subunit H
VNGRDDRLSGPKPLANSAARRVEAIIEGAEKAAGQVIDDAEARAREYLAEAEAEADRAAAKRLAELGELTEALVAQADAIRRQAELLTGSLREAKERLESEAAPAPAVEFRPVIEPVAEEPVIDEPAAPLGEGPNGDRRGPERGGQGTPHLAAVEPALPPEKLGEGSSRRREQGTHAGARLLATQMAVSGSSREEIAARLRNGFEVEDADAILDAILGPEA